MAVGARGRGAELRPQPEAARPACRPSSAGLSPTETATLRAALGLSHDDTLEGATAAVVTSRLEIHDRLHRAYERREADLEAELEAERAALAALRDDRSAFDHLFASAVRRHARGIAAAIKPDKCTIAAGPLAPAPAALPERVVEGQREDWWQAYQADPGSVRELLSGERAWGAAA